MRLSPESMWWVVLPTGDRLHGPGGEPPRDNPRDDILVEWTACGRPFSLLEYTLGEKLLEVPRCQTCCRALRIPHGSGPPAKDPGAAWKLGITSS